MSYPGIQRKESDGEYYKVLNLFTGKIQNLTFFAVTVGNPIA